MNWRKEYRESIKSLEAEDRIDLAFYRPLGFLLAKLSWRLGFSPTQVTLLGMVAGVLAGILYAAPTISNLILATLLFLLSGILDSADGQLARLSGRSTPFGLVLDGLCDNVVFISVYLGCIWPMLPAMSYWIWPIAFAAGFSHSLQSATLDFYGREYLYYTGVAEHYRNPDCEEAKNEMRLSRRGNGRWLWRLRFSWLWQQQLFNTRTEEIRTLYRQANERNTNSFRCLYRKYHLCRLRAWQPLGANIHTLGIIAFALLARFDLYLVLVDLVALNAWMLYAWRRQLNADSQMAREIMALSGIYQRQYEAGT